MKMHCSKCGIILNKDDIGFDTSDEKHLSGYCKKCTKILNLIEPKITPLDDFLDREIMKKRMKK